MKGIFFVLKFRAIKRNDIEKHYQNMYKRYYLFNGQNDVNLRLFFIASLLKELQPKLQISINLTKREMGNIILGEINQMALVALEKLC